MGIGIQQGLRRVLHTIQDVNSILITDSDGVPIITTGEPVRNIATLTNSYATALDQSNKLNLGAPKAPFVVYVMASPRANNSALCSLLDSHLKPVLDECEIVQQQVTAGVAL